MEQEHLLETPATSSQPSSHGRSGRRAKVLGGTQFVMHHHTEVVDTPNEVHAGLQRLQTLAKGGVEPLNKGGIEDGAPLRVRQEVLRPFESALRHASGDLNHPLVFGVFDHGRGQQV